MSPIRPGDGSTVIRRKGTVADHDGPREAHSMQNLRQIYRQRLEIIPDEHIRGTALITDRVGCHSDCVAQLRAHFSPTGQQGQGHRGA